MYCICHLPIFSLNVSNVPEFQVLNTKTAFTVVVITNTISLTVRLLREELQLLQEQGSYVGEVVKPMDKKKVLVKVHPEGKFVVDLDKNIDINQVTANARVALRNDSYTLHKILPNKV